MSTHASSPRLIRALEPAPVSTKVGNRGARGATVWKRFRFVLLALFSWGAIAVGPAVARQYYFSADGDDLRGEGTRASPFRSIAYLNQLDLEPGDRVLLRSGDVFEGPILLDAADSATDVDGIQRGKSIRFLSYGGRPRAIVASLQGHGIHAVDVGGVRLRGLEIAGAAGPDSVTRADNGTVGVLFENTRSFVRQQAVVLSDLDVHGFGEAGIEFRAVNPDTAAGGFAGVRILRTEVHANGRTGIVSSVRSSRGTVVDGSLYDFQARAHQGFLIRSSVAHHNYGKVGGGPSGSGIVLAQVEDARVAFNVAHHNGGVAGGGGVAIWTWESDRVAIEHNEAYANASFDGRDGGGFDLDGGTRDGRLQYNYSHGNYGAGYGLFEFGYASPMRGNLIRYNVSEDDGGGFAVWGNGPGEGAAAASLVYNNTLLFPRGPVVHALGFAADVGLYNNLFVSTAAQALVRRDDAPGIELLGNAYWARDSLFRARWNGRDYDSLERWSAGSGQESIGGAVVGRMEDPRLEGPLEGGGSLVDIRRPDELARYGPAPTSPLVDTGLSVATLPLPVRLGLVDLGGRDVLGGRVPRGESFDIGAREGQLSESDGRRLE